MRNLSRLDEFATFCASRPSLYSRPFEVCSAATKASSSYRTGARGSGTPITTKRRAWRKHIGIDADSGEIVAFDLTDKDVDEPLAASPVGESMSSRPSSCARSCVTCQHQCLLTAAALIARLGQGRWPTTLLATRKMPMPLLGLRWIGLRRPSRQRYQHRTALSAQCPLLVRPTTIRLTIQRFNSFQRVIRYRFWAPSPSLPCRPRPPRSHWRRLWSNDVFAPSTHSGPLRQRAAAAASPSR